MYCVRMASIDAGFDGDYVIGNLLEQGIGWLLAGLAMAWWLGRRRAVLTPAV